MLQARPLTGSTTQHVRRLRLLGLLPDAPGHVVWLRAPLGYGKSILAAQWAEILEIDGWRVLWTASGGDAVQSAVATSLRLPPGAPWPVIHDELSSERTLLVIEDLEGSEDLEQLLRHRHNTLLLLASRGQLNDPELSRLRTQHQLLEFGTAELAFTVEEADRLAERLDLGTAKSFWQETQGWPLPLHLALLTGSVSNMPLHEALKRSLTPAAWQEMLFMAAAGDLPAEAATEVTAELASTGVLQELSAHYRLHPLIAEALLAGFQSRVHDALEQGAARLAPIALLLAAEKAGHRALLQSTLAQLPIGTVQEYSADVRRLARLFTDPAVPAIMVRSALADLLVKPAEATLDRIEAALGSGISDDDRFMTVNAVAGVLARQYIPDKAREWLDRGMAVLPGQSLRNELHFLSNCVVIHGLAGRIPEALAVGTDVVERAAGSDIPAVRQTAVVTRMNMELLRFNQTGDVGRQLAAYEELISDPYLEPSRLSMLQLNLAMIYLYDNRTDQARQMVVGCRDAAEPFSRLWCDLVIAYIDNDVRAFPQLLQRSSNWAVRSTSERAAALWLRVCRKTGDLQTPERIGALLPDAPFVNLEKALHHRSRGDHATALQLLEKARGGHADREFEWHWQAAAFLITGDEAELDALIGLAADPAPLMCYTLIPLDRLPRSRPELAARYPLEEVLESGWTEAISTRLSEIPPLQLSLLGAFSVRVLGEPVQLPARQQQLLALIALGYSRERIAEQLWPDSDWDRTANNLSVQLHSLRRALEPWGVPTYLQDGTLIRTELDVSELRTALAAGNAAAVLRLYKGELLPALDVPVIVAERDALAEEVLALFASHAQGAAPALALPLLERILQLDPLHEQAMQLLVVKLLGLGRRNAARQRYEQFRQQLRHETGLEPRAELQALLAD